MTNDIFTILADQAVQWLGYLPGKPAEEQPFHTSKVTPTASTEDIPDADLFKDIFDLLHVALSGEGAPTRSHETTSGPHSPSLHDEAEAQFYGPHNVADVNAFRAQQQAEQELSSEQKWDTYLTGYNNVEAAVVDDLARKMEEHFARETADAYFADTPGVRTISIEETPETLTVLQRGQAIINGQRKEDYGDARESFGRIADFWSTYLDHDITGEDVAIMMMLMKIARLIYTPYHQDTQVDIAGYLGLLEHLQRG